MASTNFTIPRDNCHAPKPYDLASATAEELLRDGSAAPDEHDTHIKNTVASLATNIGALMRDIGELGHHTFQPFIRWLPEDYECITAPWQTWQYRHACFYKPEWGSCTWGNAPAMADHFYGEALAAFERDDRAQAYYLLGFALHYVQDMGVPYHAGYPLIWEHDRFEEYVRDADWARRAGTATDPALDSPAAYAKHLAAIGKATGPVITAGYSLHDWGVLQNNPIDQAAGMAIVDLASEALMAQTKGHSLGFLELAAAALPQPILGQPTYQGNTLHVPVVNVGGMDARSILVELRRMDCTNQASMVCDYGLTTIAQQVIPALTSGGQTTISFPLAAGDAVKPIVVFIDPPAGAIDCAQPSAHGCQVDAAEFREHLLGMIAPSRVAFAPLPDLSVSANGLSWSPQQGSLTIEVTNIGSRNSGAFSAGLYSRDSVSEEPRFVMSVTAPGLGPSENALLTFNYPGTIAAPLVRVDEENVVHESEDLSNNQAGLSETVWFQDQYFQGSDLHPFGDVIIRDGAIVALDGVSLRMSPGARLITESGTSLTVLSGEVAPRYPLTSIYVESAGTLRLIEAEVHGIRGGLRSTGELFVTSGTLFRSLDSSPAVTVQAGYARFDSARFVNGSGGGLRVGPQAVVETHGTLFSGNNAYNIAIIGGRLLSDQDTIQGSPLGIDVQGALHLNGTTVDGIQGLRIASETTGLHVRGGYVSGNGLTIASTETALRVEGGIVELQGGQLAGQAALVASGTGKVVLRQAETSGTHSITDQASVEQLWPVHVNAVGPGPEATPVPLARISATAATGDIVWNVEANETGVATTWLTNYRQTAAGVLNMSPYTVTSIANSSPGTATLDTTQPISIQVATPVIPDLAALHVEPLIDPTRDSLAAYVVNTQSASAADVLVRFWQDGTIAGEVVVPEIAPQSLAVVTIDRPAGTGIQTVRAEIDPLNALTEVDKGNNVVERQSWVVNSAEECAPGSHAFYGSIIVRAGGALTLRGCQLQLHSGLAGPSMLHVAAGGVMRIIDGAELAAADGADPYIVDVRGNLDVVGSTVSSTQLVSVRGGGVHVRDSALTAISGTALFAADAVVDVAESTLSGNAGASGVVVRGGTVSLRNNTFTGFEAGSVHLHNVTGDVASGNLMRDSAIGYSLVNASVILRDEVIGPNVTDSIHVIASRPMLINVDQIVESMWIDTSSRADIAWTIDAGVVGADGAGSPNQTITAIDRFGQWIGQFDTGSDGFVRGLVLVATELTDSNGDGRPIQVDEIRHRHPYTLEAGSQSVQTEIAKGISVSIPGTYRLALESTNAYHRFSPGQTLPYEITVKNLGNVEDSIAISAALNRTDWSATVTPTSMNLQPGQSVIINVDLTAPQTANSSVAGEVFFASEDGSMASGSISGKTGPNLPPIALAYANPGAAYRGEPVSFVDASKDTDGWIAAWNWSFPDGTFSNSQNAAYAFGEIGMTVVRLTVHDNAGATSEVDLAVNVMNRKPVLEDLRVTPSLGDSSTTFTFEVLYRDIDGDAPLSVDLIVDGQRHSMTATGPSTYDEGVLYTKQLALPPGAHRYRAEAVDVPGASVLFPANFDLLGPRVNDAPTLTNVGASPSSGTTDTLFTFSARYADSDGDPPASVKLMTSDGRMIAMHRQDASSPDYRAGVVYGASTTIASASGAGYRIVASDAYHTTQTPHMPEPTVSAETIQLGKPRVEPEMGPPGVVFDFLISYADANGEGPDEVVLILDGVARSMAAQDPSPDYVAGAWFAVEVPLAAAGTHTYHFEVWKDGELHRHPATGHLRGPIVNSAPTIVPQTNTQSGTIGTLFAVDLSMVDDSETPTSELHVRVDWGDGNRTPWSTDRIFEHRFAKPGAYTAALQVKDEHGAETAVAVDLQVLNGAPRAAFDVTPEIGNAAEDGAFGTLFTFRPGATDDEQGWDALTVRWDWNGDGTWDTDWQPINGHAGHMYPAYGNYNVIMEVQDTGGMRSQANRTITVIGTGILELGETSQDSLRLPGQRQYYRLLVPPNGFNLEVQMTYEAVAGVNYDLYISPGVKPDPLACSPPNCRSSTSTATGGTESVCMRLPDEGQYYVLVHAKTQTGTTVPYEILARTNVLDARQVIAQCLVFG